MKKKGMYPYYENVLKGGNTDLHSATFQSRDGVQKVVASIPDEQSLTESKQHTVQDMRWNGNLQRRVRACTPVFGLVGIYIVSNVYGCKRGLKCE
jgi:hypothetical protein